ncbi:MULTISPECIES: Re/Si-specific NAD(P)(+) transhydrogenase subunit alpha [Acinetobacter]|mgnify:FL=1|jgi:H+-translocating NAD(P) transhydrogenase subunit alpha|uniref:proton-translocating NAD(P)(+) transhydrogenase n=1 Tax=Acinetobacter lwoffii TaxID=28090 RepID=A0AAW8ATL5_ACILW|nr:MULTISPECIES: Re/Si-specific NAD(P)(+) transhydrogenase subunit alpha [Acinetobacter]ODN55667.1 NAD(P) transhydrogenase subunit alpha [Acinetobacter sp. 51m]RDC51934.1 Re/Si-specific NAD(P)(+) transhydrogenase subunit alpha [Acinetobacter sp. RIT592]EEY88796.1 putative NAD(P)(+) transhydrogenase (AB-specific), alpha subunit [Acinetobacter lwoffii SH145]ENX26247.1 NAD(P)(+) transhydrogenase (AB-specific), alpha subunit [Acinetobacter sp. CIP 101966]MCO8080432.1 Re/Si-specific NAD(P)(+) trans
MQIGIPAETVVGENRVAATPETVKKLISAGHSVIIERGAGVKAAYIDSAYEQVGAKITDDAYTGSQLILKVRAPKGDEIQKLNPNTTIVAMFDPYRNTELDQFAAQNVSAFALELLPRTLSRAQNMDVLSSQANLAGYKSVLLAAAEYQRMFPMLMTAAGTVKPARVVIMGVGVAGLQAIATAKRLGAIVEATDLRPTAKDQVESLGGKWLDVPMSAEEQQKAADAAKNGYGWMPGEEYIRDQAAIVDKAVSNADIVITTALLPGRDAPRLIRAGTVAKMKPGSVILDMAVESGGNVEGSKCGETVHTDNGVKILGIPNIPSTVSTEASALYARNVFNFVETLFDADKNFVLNQEEEIQKALLVTHGGQVLLKRG